MRDAGAPDDPPAAPPGTDADRAARILVTGARSALTRNAEQAVTASATASARTVLVLQGGDLPHALAHWRTRCPPGTLLLGVRGPGEHIATTQVPAGCPVVEDPLSLERRLQRPGPLLAIATLAGAAVVAAAHCGPRTPRPQLLLVEDVLALEAGGHAGRDLLSETGSPAQRLILQATATSVVDAQGRLWTLRPGPRYGRERVLGPVTSRAYRLHVPVRTPVRPSNGTALLDDAVRLAVATAARPGVRRVAVVCPDDHTVRRVASRARALLHGQAGAAAAGVRTVMTLTPRERESVLCRLARGARALIVASGPIPGPAVDALMLLAPGRTPWAALAVLEAALADPAPELLLLTGPVEIASTRRGPVHACLTGPASVVRALAALDPRLRRRLAAARTAPGDPFGPHSALDWVSVPHGLSPRARHSTGETLLAADTPRTAPRPRPDPSG
ncbi:hypothetical protein AB0O91_00010 [Kitasatospora sp. NPDC089797]|uniref:hypothetical protein n=1 Tax=Kitasatospora sp. NPDC089797 TaxID=3155298 RepID=UPI0034415C01